MAYEFFLGIDVAESEGGTDAPGIATLALVEKTDENVEGADVGYRLDSVRVFAPDAPAAEIASHVQSLVADSPYIGRTSIIVNRGSNRGQAIEDALTDLGLGPVAATITENSSDAAPTGPDRSGVNASAHEIVDTLAREYRSARFSVEHRETEHASRLARELQSYVEYVVEPAEGEAPSDLDDAPARPDAYDNHVTAAGLAVWFGSERTFDPASRLKEDPNTEPMGQHHRP